MKMYLLPFMVLLLAQTAIAQSTRKDSIKAFLKKIYFANQKELDRATSGIGIEHSTVKFGNNYKPVTFNKVIVRANIVEFKLGIGDAYYYSPQSELTYNTQVNHWSIGINYPLSVLGIGRANSTRGIRLVPFIAADFGHSSFKEPATNSKLAESFHLSVAPGYRLKIPFLIVDFRLNTTWNNLTETKYHPTLIAITSTGDIIKEKSFKTFNVTPTISIIIDGLFSKFNPKFSRIAGSVAVYDKVTKKEYYTTENYNSRTGKMEKDGLYKTETTYEYHVESVTLPINDIGAFIGVGPRLIYKPVSKNSYRMPTLMGGVGAHGRIKMFSFDINADKGTAGFSGQVKENGKPITSDIIGKGSFDMTNVTANAGIDLGPFLLAVIGIGAKRSGETPYFNISGGFIFGYSFIGNYKYNDKVVGQSYQAYFDANPDARTIYNDAASNKSGIVHGWYVGADVGAVGFRYEFNKYNNAPLARCGYYSISYKFPLLRSSHSN